MAENRINIDRWIIASIGKWYTDHALSLPLLIEGQGILPLNTATYAQLRMTGPVYDKLQAHYHRFDVIINILCNVVMDTDAHKIYRFTGTFEKASVDCIPVMKYGLGPDDNAMIHFGDLVQCRNGTALIDTQHFGIVNNDTRLQQSTVETYYRLIYNGDLH